MKRIMLVVVLLGLALMLVGCPSDEPTATPMNGLSTKVIDKVAYYSGIVGKTPIQTHFRLAIQTSDGVTSYVEVTAAEYDCYQIGDSYPKQCGGQ